MGHGDPTTPVLEAFTILVTASERIRAARIGTLVTNVMNRHPAVLARMVSTVQDVSGGRFRLGLGIGGNPREHAAYGIPFPEPRERAEHLVEAIAILRGLWAGGPFSYEGRHYRLADAYARPIPSPPPPIIVGAQSPAGVRIAAAHADGWAAELPSFLELQDRYLEALHAAGRDRGTQTVVLGFNAARRLGRRSSTPPGRTRRARRWTVWRERGMDEAALAVRTADEVRALVAAAESGR
jgi:alkanesulfonate monooxygenase SsuD/methylene tetrahydromethanopterin reductase-like flavin-dependent oxidoreductase (luciferase family)